MSIHVDGSQMQGEISPLIYGAVVEWFDKYLDSKSEYYQDTIRKVNVAGLTNFRIGGTPTEYYHWKEPRGYYEVPLYEVITKHIPMTTTGHQERLVCNVDSLMKFVQESNISNIVISVNFVRGTAKEAAEWVRYCNVEKKYGIKYWEIGNEVGYFYVRSWLRNNVRKYYFGGCEFQEGEKLGVSNGLPSQTLNIKYPPVKNGLTVYVGSSGWQLVDNIRTAGKGDFYEYRESFTPGLYYKGEILFGDGINGNIPPRGAIISGDYNSGPHDGLIHYISQMKAVDPTIKVGPCGDEIDWYHENVTEWTRTLLKLDSTQTDPRKEFDFIAPHWHTVRLGDDACQALHRQDNFEHGVKKLKEAIAAAYEATTKPHKVNLPIFIDEWKAVYWNPPMEQKLWCVLFVASGLGMLAKNKIAQASMTHLHAYLTTDGILAYENRDPAYKPNQEMPIFYAFQLVGNKFGKVLIECSCEESSLGAYASVDRENPNKLCLLVINRDSTYNLKSSIEITGFTPQATADVWILNGDGMDLSTGININGVKLDGTDVTQINKIAPRKVMNVSDSFSYTFPAHSVVMMQLSSDKRIGN